MRVPLAALRRGSPFVGSLLALVLVLAGCGSVKDDEPASSGTTSTSGSRSADAADASAFPATFPNKFGKTTIPSVPDRVAVVGYSEQDAVLAVGVKPIATREWFGEKPGATWEWAQDELGGAKPTVINGELDYDKLFQLKPDLIIGVYAGLDKSAYTRLSKIAPTLIGSPNYPDYGVPWRASTRLIAKALGRTAAGEKAIAATEKAFAQARAKYSQLKGRTFSFAYDFGDGELGLYGPGDARFEFLKELGMKPTATTKNAKDTFVKINDETIDLVEADAVVWVSYPAKGTSLVQNNPVYKRLKAHKQGRDFFIPEKAQANGAVSFGSVLSFPTAIAQLAPRLVAAVDGDRATSTG